MAKYRVIHKPYFRDIHTKEKHFYNDILNITEERAEEILKVGNLIEKIEEKEQDQEINSLDNAEKEEKPTKKSKKTKK